VDERDAIDKLADAVAERSPVSWEDELRSAPGDEDRDVVEQLRVVDRIVDAHWGRSGAPERLGDFEIIREIGRGAMGVVYEARQISLDRRVAVKVLAREMTADPVRLRRFEREAKSLASLNHPNIVTIHSVENTDDVHFIGMELVEGQDLALLIPRGGLPVEKLLDVAIPMADALSSAHERHIVHRDLKPANVMINSEGRVKILDFGLAKLRGETRVSDESAVSTVDVDMTREGFVVGTIPYMSPEQAEGREIDPRSDLFSLGTVLYEMATGERPFGGDSQSEIVTAIANETPLPAAQKRPELPEDLDRIITHCLRKDPERRYQTAKGLRNELEELKRKRDLDRLPRPPVPKWPLWAAISTAAVLLAVLLFGGRIVEIARGPFDGTPATPFRYLAVMPFIHSGGDDPRINAFTDGLTEILTAKLTRLTKTHALQIAPPSRVRGVDIAEIEEKVGVNLAIRGTIRPRTEGVARRSHQRRPERSVPIPGPGHRGRCRHVGSRAAPDRAGGPAHSRHHRGSRARVVRPGPGLPEQLRPDRERRPRHLGVRAGTRERPGVCAGPGGSRYGVLEEIRARQDSPVGRSRFSSM
jgi:serine/threonine protein kinase